MMICYCGCYDIIVIDAVVLIGRPLVFLSNRFIGKTAVVYDTLFPPLYLMPTAGLKWSGGLLGSVRPRFLVNLVKIMLYNSLSYQIS